MMGRSLTKLSTTAIAVAMVASLLITQSPRRADAGIGDEGAGGRAVAHYAGGKVIRGNNHGPVSKLFRMKDAQGTPVKAGEPTLGVTNEGNIFYTAIQGNTRVEIMRSTNEGKTWDVVSPKLPNGRNSTLLSFDPYLWVDDAEGVDRIFSIDLTVACAYLSFSDDEGETWTTNPVACGRPVNDHQTLFSGPPAISPTLTFPHVVYYCWNDIGSSSCSKSLDGGVTWAPTGSPAFLGYDPNAEEPGVPESPTQRRPANCGGLHGHGHVGADGTVFMPKGHCGQPWLAISKDEGATWERIQVAKNGVSDHEASVATDRKGNIYYAYVGRDRLIYLVTSTDEGATWSKPMMVSAPKVNESDIPSIDVGGVGKIAIAYMGSTNSPGIPFPPQTGTQTNPDCFVAQLECPPPPGYEKTTWNGYTTISANVLDKNPVFYSAPVNDPKDPLKRGTCGPGRCGLTILDFIDVVIAPDGGVWSAWVDACTLACAEPNATEDAGGEAVVGHFVGGPNLR